LKNTGKGNLFVIFGEPDITILPADDGRVRVKVNGVDVFHPQTGEVRSDGPDGIACWFIDTDYNEESFFVRHAYFLGAQDPYKGLKAALKAEIDEDAWATLYRDTSRPFPRPSTVITRERRASTGICAFQCSVCAIAQVGSSTTVGLCPSPWTS
jgi:adenine-specific DNA-methyltransferase